MRRCVALMVVFGLVTLSEHGGARAADLLRVEGTIVKWPPPPTGTTTVITYAVLTRPYLVSRDKRTLSPDNCGAMRPFSDVVAHSENVDEDSSRRELRSALSAWENVVDIKFVEVGEPATAHIVVGATETSAGPAFANLSLRGRRGLQHSADKALDGVSVGQSDRPVASSDAMPFALIEQAFVCLNPKVRWKVGFDGNLKVYDLRHTFMHEIGHAIGLDHAGRSGSIMGFRYDESIRQPQSSDIIAAQRLYGPPVTN